MTEMYKNMHDQLVSLFKKAQDNKQLRKDLDVEAICFHLISFSEGAAIIGALLPVFNDKKIMEMNYIIFDFYITGNLTFELLYSGLFDFLNTDYNETSLSPVKQAIVVSGKYSF